MGFSLSRLRAVTAVCLAALVAVGCMGAEGRKARHLEKGEAYLAAGDLEKARVEFRNALQIAPTDSQARYENGVVAEKFGDLRSAGQFYQAAIDTQTDNVAARAALGRLYILVGRADKALETVKPSLEKHPGDARLLTVRAAARAQQKDLDGARQDAEQAIAADPKSEDAVAVLAGVYKAQGETARAQTALEEGIKRIPGTVDLRLALAQLEASLGKNQDAETNLVEIVRLRPNEKAQRLRLAQFYARENRTDDAERVLRDAVKAMPKEHELKAALIDFLGARRSREIAEKELNGLINADPKDYQLRFLQAQFYEQGKDLKQAESVYQRIIADAGLEEAGLRARDRLAALRVQQNNVPGAQKLIAEVLDKSPRDDDALILRGNLSLAQNNPREAIADLRAVLRDQPNAVGVMRSLARAHVANGEPALAEETMRRAMEINPRDPAVRLDLAQLLAQLGKPEQAKPVIDELVKAEPTNAQALDAQFKIALATKDLVTAKAAADAIAASQPKSGVGLFYQGQIAELDKRDDDALRLYAASADLSPEAAEPLQGLVRVLVATKRVPEALKRLDDLIARDAERPIAANLKGEVLLTQQRTAEAIAPFKLAIARAPQWPVPYRNLALAELGTHDSKGAVETLRAGIAAVPVPEPLEFDLATVYEKIGRPNDAIDVYEGVLKRHPDSDPVSNNLAMLLVTYKSDRASLDHAKALVARFASSNNPNYLDTYGWVLYKRGEATQAISILQTVLSKADSPVSLYHLGMAEALAGQTDAARDSLARSLQAGKRFTGMDEAKATLDKLGKGAPVNAQAKS